MGRQLYVKSGASVWYEITDPHGDVAALATASALVGTEHFDVWGNLLGSNGTTIPFGYQGSEGSWTDSTTGFVSMGLRWYYPKVGRFESSDPITGSAGFLASAMRWPYAFNEPVVRDDPLGLDPPSMCVDGTTSRHCSTDGSGGDVNGNCNMPGASACPVATAHVPTTPKFAPCDKACQLATAFAIAGGALCASAAVDGVGAFACVVDVAAASGAINGVIDCPHDANYNSCVGTAMAISGATAAVSFGVIHIAGRIGGNLGIGDSGTTDEPSSTPTSTPPDTTSSEPDTPNPPYPAKPPTVDRNPTPNVPHTRAPSQAIPDDQESPSPLSPVVESPDAPAPLLPAGRPSGIVPNAFEPHEASFAQDILSLRGGSLTGPPTRGLPGVDGFLDGYPISLKGTQGGLSAVLRSASRAEQQGRNAGYSGIDLYINAPNADVRRLVDFGMSGALSQIPEQGVIRTIYVLAGGHWIQFGAGV